MSLSVHQGCGGKLSQGAGDLPPETRVKSCMLNPVRKDSPHLLRLFLQFKKKNVEVPAICVSVDIIYMIYSKIIIRWGGL